MHMQIDLVDLGTCEIGHVMVRLSLMMVMIVLPWSVSVVAVGHLRGLLFVHILLLLSRLFQSLFMDELRWEDASAGVRAGLHRRSRA